MNEHKALSQKEQIKSLTKQVEELKKLTKQQELEIQRLRSRAAYFIKYSE